MYSKTETSRGTEMISELDIHFKAIRKIVTSENWELDVCRNMLSEVAETIRSCLPPVLVPDLTAIDHILYSDKLPRIDCSKKLRSPKQRTALAESCLKHCHGVFSILIQEGASNLLLDSTYLQLLYGMPTHGLGNIKMPIENVLSICLLSEDRVSLCYGVKLLRVLLTKHRGTFEDTFYDQVFLIKRMTNLPTAKQQDEIAITKWLRSQATYICSKFLNPRSIYSKIPALQELEGIALRFLKNDFMEAIGQLVKLCRDCKNGATEMFHGDAFLTTGILDSIESFLLVGSKNELAKRKRAKYFLQSCLRTSSTNSNDGVEATQLRESLEILVEVLTGLFDYYFEMANSMGDKINLLVLKSTKTLVDHSLSKASLSGEEKFNLRSFPEPPKPRDSVASYWSDKESFGGKLTDEDGVEGDYVEEDPDNVDFTIEHFMFYEPLIKVSQIILAIHSMSLHWGELLHNEISDPLISRSKFNSPCFTNEIFSFLCENKGRAWWYKPILMKCPFLASFSCREEFFRHLLQKRTKNAGIIKFQLNRENILKDMTTIFDSQVDVNKRWTFQFLKEIGEGNGVTKEVYSLFSKSIQRHYLNLWIGSPTTDDPMTAYTFSENGLFPNPLKFADEVDEFLTLRTFRTVGKMLAKSFMDNQMLDIDFCPPLFKFLVNCEQGKVVYNDVDLKAIVPMSPRFVGQLISLVTSKQALEAKYDKDSEELKKAIESLNIDGCSIEDLGIDFTLPGYPDVEMTEGGKDMTLTAHNVNCYFDLILQWYLVKGTKSKLDAIRDGFFSTIPMRYMSLFYYDEAKLLFCGTNSTPWERKEILENCNLVGYTKDCSAVDHLLRVMCSLNSDGQKDFLQFVTASLRLPIDGFASLTPSFTISLFKVDDPDSYLPVAATCFNRLMLPSYSSEAITRQKLFYAMQEGKDSFQIV